MSASWVDREVSERKEAIERGRGSITRLRKLWHCEVKFNCSRKELHCENTVKYQLSALVPSFFVPGVVSLSVFLVCRAEWAG